MASTRKGGKKVTKAGKTAASKSRKAAASRSRAASVTNVPADPSVDHPPVIITDGSASIRLHEATYPGAGNVHTSAGLRLEEVLADKRHTNGSFTCHRLTPGQRIEIKVSCRISGGGGAAQRSFTIVGGNSNAAQDSPTVTFDHAVFPGGGLDAPGRRIFRNANRDIVSLEIFDPPGSANRIHDCSVVRDKQDYVITIADAHDH